MFQVREESYFYKFGKAIRLSILWKQDFLQAEKQDKEN
jgi:hypothetical protein